jgi:hypothetical protein
MAKHIYDSKARMTKHLARDRGAGKRMSWIQKQVFEGHIHGDLFDFVRAVDIYRQVNEVYLLKVSDYFEIMLALGFRRVSKLGKYSLDGHDPHISSSLVVTDEEWTEWMNEKNRGRMFKIHRKQGRRIGATKPKAAIRISETKEWIAAKNQRQKENKARWARANREKRNAQRRQDTADRKAGKPPRVKRKKKRRTT